MFAISAYAGFQPEYVNADVDFLEETNTCKGCDLSGHTRLSCRSGVILDGAILNNSAFRANGYSRFNCPGSSFKNTVAYGLSLGYGDYSSSDFSGSILTASYLEDGNLSGVNFSNCDLKSANLRKANLTRVNFSGADLTDANLESADLTQSNITQQQLESTSSFCGAILPNGEKARTDCN